VANTICSDGLTTTGRGYVSPSGFANLGWSLTGGYHHRQRICQPFGLEEMVWQTFGLEEMVCQPFGFQI
jgi:hypothetical protein